jgi:phospholipid/cholesterol/gamma-HCH transport system substrate-binding protein
MLRKYFTREVKIGLLIIVSGFILFFGFNYLKGVNIFNPTNYYRASFSDIGGLQETGPVLIKGHKVGQVKKISYDFTKEESFVITLDVSTDLKLPQGTVAELFDDGLMGGKAIRLVLPKNQTNELYKKGDFLPSKVVPGLTAGLSDELLPKINRLLESADSLISSVRVITESSQLKNTMSSIEQVSADLEVSSSQLKHLMNNDIPKIAHNVNALTEDFAVTGNNLSKIDFEQTTNKLDKAAESLEGVTQKINNGTGTLGLLVNDPALYNNLSATSQNANSLLIDLQNNPKRYVHFSIWGKSDKKDK